MAANKVGEKNSKRWIHSLVFSLFYGVLTALPAASQQDEPLFPPAPPTEPSQLITSIVARLESTDEESRLKAGLELLDNARRDDVAYLSKALKEGGNPDRQVFIIEALARIGDRRSADALRFELQRGDVVSRRAAVTALGYLNFNYPIADLHNLMVDEKTTEVETRKRAASALGRIGSTEAIYALENGIAAMRDLSVVRAAQWAIDVARGKVDERRVDVDMPRGQHLELYYKGTKYKFYHPSLQPRLEVSDGRPTYKPRMLICIHGSDLNYEATYQSCAELAQKRQMALLVPYFDNMRYPDYDTFNLHGERSDKRLFELIDHIQKTVAVEPRELYFYGDESGGSFVQKFALVYPDRIARAVAVVKGELTFPRTDQLFPAGIKVSPLAPDVRANLDNFVKSNVRFVAVSPVAAKVMYRFLVEVERYSIAQGIMSRLEFKGALDNFGNGNKLEKEDAVPKVFDSFFFHPRILR